MDWSDPILSQVKPYINRPGRDFRIAAGGKYFLLENGAALWHNGTKSHAAPDWRRRRKGDGMFHTIYSLPLRQVVALMLITIPMWAFGQLREGRSLRAWRIGNWVLFAITLLVILSFTLFQRTSGAGQINLIPFSSFVRARTEQPELYREILMNVLLFFPLGLSLSSALPHKRSVGRRFCLTVLAGLCVSVAVEAIQFVFKLGMAEVDDLMTNSFGAALGASQLLLSRILWKLKR
jgi:glycopeptide antibiotics resistance protein